MKIAICDDEEKLLDLIEGYIKGWCKKNKTQIDIDKFFSAEEFLFEWENYEKYDAIFLDTEMKKMSGIELSNIIRKKNKTVNLIFLADEIKYALHGYKVGALQYLIKPIKKEEAFECLDMIKEKIKDINDNFNYITIELPKKSIKLNYENIIYCIMFSPYIDIYTINDKITIRKKISDMEEILPKESFIRCHRSYLVNIKHISVVNKDTVTLEDGTKIPISRGKYEEVNQAFINYFL